MPQPYLPGLSDYQAAVDRRRQGEQQQLSQLQGLLALQGEMLQQKARREAMQRDKSFRTELGALGTNPDQGALAQLAAKYSAPQDILRTQQSSLDRKATLESANINREAQREQRLHEIQIRGEQAIERVREQAAQQRITKEEADRREAVMREQMARLAASLRPAPQEQPLVSIIGSDGKPVLVPRREAVGKTPASTEKPMNEFQGKASLYGTRAAQSDKILKSLEGDISTSGLTAKQAIQNLPLVGGALGVVGNLALSSEQQRVEQAQRDFVNAVLRQESGAVISDAEFKNAQRQYFPQPGDDKKTVEQKRQNRKLAIGGFKRMAGAGAADIDAIMNSPLIPSSKSVLEEADKILGIK